MKAIRTTIITLALTLSSMVAMAQPMSFESVRMNARFLTDRIAYTLGIRDPYTIDAIYQINYDYIYGVNDYLDDVALGYRYDDYMSVCYARDTALERLLGRALWTTLMGYDYFYRPISFMNHRWSFGIYVHDRRHDYFYHPVPGHFHDYHGGHYFVGMRPIHGGNRIGPRHDWNSHVHHSPAYNRPRVEPNRHGNNPGYSIGGNNRPANNVNGNDRPGYNTNGGNRPGYSVGGNDRPGNNNNRPNRNVGGGDNRGQRSEGNTHSSSRVRTNTTPTRSGNVGGGGRGNGGQGFSGGGGSRGNNGGGRGRQ